MCNQVRELANAILINGRKTNTNSVFWKAYVHICPLLPMPFEALSKPDKLRRTFLWERKSEGQTSSGHMEKIIMLKDQSGIGIRDLSKHSTRLLLKWWWKFSQGTPSMEGGCYCQI